MCLIAVAPRGADKYDEKFLAGIRESLIGNSDGIGFAYKSNLTNDVFFAKGFTSYQGFLAAYKTHDIKKQDDCIIHLRKGNKGGLSDVMCHPFTCVADNKDLIPLTKSFHGYSKDMIMFHNGTLQDYYNPVTPGLSDTYNFAKQFMSVKEIQRILIRDVKEFALVFEHTLKTNKLAFLVPNDESSVLMIGDFNTSNGYFYSNRSHEIFKSRHSAFEEEDYARSWGNESEFNFWPKKNNPPLRQLGQGLVIPIVNVVVPFVEEDQDPVEVVDYPVVVISKVPIVPSGIGSHKLTYYNHMDFNFIAKKSAVGINNRISEGRMYFMNTWSVQSVHGKQTLSCKSRDMMSFFEFSIKQVEENFFITPKITHQAMYADLLSLKTMISNPTKNFMKKLKTLLVNKLARIPVDHLFVSPLEGEYDKYGVAAFYFLHLGVLYKNNELAIAKDIICVLENLRLSDKEVTLLNSRKAVTISKVQMEEDVFVLN